MTDGIIQKWYKEYELKFTKPSDQMLFQIITTELIEKIKEEISPCFRCACVDTDEIIKVLLGDTT